MRSRIKIIFILVGIISLFNSCKNDLKILAPYKEAVSVYGILDPWESRHYIRINKIFLGEGNAYDMAKISDSINYASGTLTVTLERFVNGTQMPTTVGNTKTVIYLKDTMLLTASGTFNINQRVYFTDDKIYRSGDYKLTIKNNHTGNVFTAKADIIDSIKPFYAPLSAPYYPVAYSPTNPPSDYIDYTVPTANSDRTLTVNFFPPSGGAEYTGIIRFFYIDSLLGGVTVNHSVDFQLQNTNNNHLLIHPTFGTLYGSFSFTTSELLQRIYSEITKGAGQPNLVARRAIKMGYLITAANKTFHDFLQISAPSTSVAQDKPAYTNIDGGFGVFASRSTFYVEKSFANQFLDYMSSRKPMCQLAFKNSAGNQSFSCN